MTINNSTQVNVFLSVFRFGIRVFKNLKAFCLNHILGGEKQMIPECSVSQIYSLGWMAFSSALSTKLPVGSRALQKSRDTQEHLQDFLFQGWLRVHLWKALLPRSQPWSNSCWAWLPPLGPSTTPWPFMNKPMSGAKFHRDSSALNPSIRKGRVCIQEELANAGNRWTAIWKSGFALTSLTVGKWLNLFEPSHSQL